MELTLSESTEFFQKLSNQEFMKGTRLIEKINEYQVILEVDIEILPIRNFMALLVEECSFSDISIKELPMEEVITRIYEKTK